MKSTPVGRALWFVESHLSRDLTLDEVANAAGVSRYHMCKVFAITTGQSIMRYVRGRRLTEAARALLKRPSDILRVALDAGYGSHEAFTRAFRDQFGATPESIRAKGTLENLQVVEAMRGDEHPPKVVEARMEKGRLLLIAGVAARYDCESSVGIAAQWQTFVPHLTRVPKQAGKAAYGVMCNFDDNGAFDYVCGVEVAAFSQIPLDWRRMRIPPQDYAVFTHRDHISAIRSTWAAIWAQWLPESGREVVDAPSFELYGEDFDSVLGRGSVEIWLPVVAEMGKVQGRVGPIAPGACRKIGQ
jgi:AraC family transcriptional regulator